jgi:hypothetical protein
LKQVKCISPHGGCHNGMYADGRGSPVFHVWDAGDQAKGIEGSWKLPAVPPEQLALPPNPGGYVDDGRIAGRFAAVGQVYDVPDEFIADGFHWEDVAPKQPPTPPASTPPAPPEGTP